MTAGLVGLVHGDRLLGMLVWWVEWVGWSALLADNIQCCFTVWLERLGWLIGWIS